MKSPITLTAAAWVLTAGICVAEPIDSVRLTNLVKQECGSCHGLTLQGGLGPALTPEALKDQSDEVLITTILYGRPQNAMPPWDDILTREEAEWIVEKLREGM